MRIVRYKVLPPINPFDDPVPNVHGSLVEFLFTIPSLLDWDVLPPLSILNEILLSGIKDAGMSGGCQWKPFQLEPDEYEELVLELLTLPGKTFYREEPPEQINTYKDWWRWMRERRATPPAV